MTLGQQRLLLLMMMMMFLTQVTMMLPLEVWLRLTGACLCSAESPTQAGV
jgi:hypothetical protein